ncbi:MAG TPA: hypothetical protein VJX70_14480 [Candidatus Acidoferrum sp.]|nr:hypothetical protein [Candidatus Acidoferrum sp.]
MLLRPQIRFLASCLIAFAAVLPLAEAQPKRDKIVTNLDGGVFMETDGAIPGGACFRVKGRLNDPDFFETLKREDSTSGTLFRRGNDVVTEFPIRVHVSLMIYDVPCDPRQAPTSSRVYLTEEMVGSLRLSFFWKHELELRPVRGVVESGGVVRPVPWYSHGLEEELPRRFEWSVDFDVPSESVPLTDSLVLVFRTADHRFVARFAARL